MAFWNRKKSGESLSAFSSPRETQTAQAPSAHSHQAPPIPKVPHSLAGVKNNLAIASGKGGVGKSTVATHLAVALRAAGFRVGLLDADIYGPTQPAMMGPGWAAPQVSSGTLYPVKKHGIDFISMGILKGGEGAVVWRAPMAVKVIHQFIHGVAWGELDYLLIDLPPGTGDVQLTLAQQASLTGAIIVTTPQDVALNIAQKAAQMFVQLNVPIVGVVENMSGFSCPHCHEQTAIFKEGGGRRLAQKQNLTFLGALPLDPQILASGDDGEPLLTQDLQSPAAKAFLMLSEAVQKRVAELQLESGVGQPLSVEKNCDLSGQSALKLKWFEGGVGNISAYQLRVHCGCAVCVDENTGRPVLDPKKISPDIQLESFEKIGRYALSLRFSDGHSTGIYPYSKLKILGESQTETAPLPVNSLPESSDVAPRQRPAADSEMSKKLQNLLDEKVNPGVAAHGGHIGLVKVEGTKVYLEMSGGCRGCSSASQTLSQGVERAIKNEFPQVTEVIDTTRHDLGDRPYYS